MKTGLNIIRLFFGEANATECAATRRETNVSFVVASITLLILSTAGCSKGSSTVESPDTTRGTVLLEAGDTCLLLEDVLSRIPTGIEPEDSAALFNSIVESWIQSQLINDIAGEYGIDTERIERMVNAYRNQLILSEYRRHLRSGGKEVSEDSVRSYYENHLVELTSETPLVKGVYVKLSDQSASDGKVAALLSRVTARNSSTVEKRVLKEAIQYENFTDRWVDWQTIADQIPYRFFDPDAFLESTKNFSTSYNGNTYILHITEYMPSGSEMPYEFAAPKIREKLSKRSIAEEEKRLLDRLYRQALKDGKVKKVGYDPVSRKLIKKSSEL